MYKFLFILINILISSIQCGFLDIVDIEDSLDTFWKWAEKRKEPAQCIINNDDHHPYKYGVCMEIDKCKLKGGTPHQKCGILYTCCHIPRIHSGCNQVSAEKQSKFEFSNYDSSINTCHYEIKLRNTNICQVRLDFEKMILEGTDLKTLGIPQQHQSPVTSYPYPIYPIYPDGDGTLTGFERYAELCLKDQLKIYPNNYGVPKVLCGNNTGQHIYIHLNQTEHAERSITIDIQLADRSNMMKKLLDPSWIIKFNQLECPMKKTKFDLTKYKHIDTVNDDFNLLAPLGVIQYHFDKSGQIRSFGYGGSNSYPYNNNYVIGFKRSINACQIRFDIDSLSLLPNFDTIDPSSINVCLHYLYIPQMIEPLVLCGQSRIPPITTFTSKAPGPFLLYFNATLNSPDKYSYNEIQGFQLNYEISSWCT